jgi:hypothetical protein
METTPRAVAEMIRLGAQAVGARVTYSNADDRGRFGRMYIEMPDGVATSIQIELEN